MPPKRAKKTESVAIVEPEAIAQAVVVATPVVEAASPPAAKKKTKKPVKVVAVVTPNGIEGSFMPEPRRPLIAHLHVHSNEINFGDEPVSTGVEPEPFNPCDVNMFAADQEPVLTTAAETAAAEATEKEESLYVKKQEVVLPSGPTPLEARPMQCYAKVKLMVQYEEGVKAKALPLNTNIACFWCAHTFDTQPCIIPEREVAGVYNVYGNFCCPECGLAYLLNQTIDPHVRWERIALLHRIYDREGRGRMFPAPPRELLKLFGGPLTVDSYRATIRQGKVRVDLHMPPMVSILGSIDTKPIDFFDSSLKNTMVGALQLEKTTKAEEGLRLKRSKPLKDRDSTLDSVMNINIRQTSVSNRH